MDNDVGAAQKEKKIPTDPQQRYSIEAKRAID